MLRFDKHIIWLITLVLPAIGFTTTAAESNAIGHESVIQFSITENDTNTYHLNLALDENGRPLHFFRNIFTPVCITGECKPVYVNFYWDLLGNYTHYDMPEGEILTKMDHDEFSEEDYAKLQDILINSTSLLKDIEMEDLISSGTENLADSVDVKSGATLKSIKKEVIEGAVYTCYTLWHIAYGKVVTDKMRSITDSLSDDRLLHTFLMSNNHHYQYWAMAKVIDGNGLVRKDYMEDLKHIIQGKNIFAARYALQKISPGQLEAQWLWELNNRSNYAYQMEILKKMTEMTVPEKILQMMIGAFPNFNQTQSALVVNIIASQKQLSAKVIKILSELLNNPPSDINDRIFSLLSERKIADSVVKQNMLAYQKQKQPKP